MPASAATTGSDTPVLTVLLRVCVTAPSLRARALISSPGSSCARIRAPAAPALGPDSATRPTSSTYAVCASCSAMCAFCSTTSTVRPFGVVQVLDDAEDLRHEQRREAERRLVEQQQPRALHERAREREHLLLAAAERAGLLVAPLLDPREVRLDAREVVLDRAAPRVRAEPQVLPDGELGERAAALGHVRDAEPRHVVGPAAADRLAGEADARPRGGRCSRSRAASSSCPRRSRRGRRRSGPRRPSSDTPCSACTGP